MSIQRLISRWRAEPSIGGNVAVWQHIPARPARTTPYPASVYPALAAALQGRGIQRLYLHQSLAFEQAQAGENLVVVTGTASGKTLCYNLPVLDRLLRDDQARALYLFPTKALAQDQANGLAALLEAAAQGDPSARQVRPAVYDGDTPAAHRPAIRKNARLVISNPDMLHTGILPHHTIWADFLSRLSYVVIDEMHAYRGVFGSHVANVLRRLVRVARFYGAAPQFILTSATIANPVELGERMIEAPVTLVDQDGAARGAKTFLFYNPPVVDKELGLRRSSMHESVRLAEDLLAGDVQTILFARSRRTVELVLTYLRQRVPGDPGGGIQDGDAPPTTPAVRGYRSGYLPGVRREIERGLRQGDVRAVVATNALELGVDIGGMGAAILVGYPGTIAGAWQQAGRAGRSDEDALAVLVATADPLDQFLVGHPEYFFGRAPESALINPDNLLILLDHLRCAAFELPFKDGEGFGRLPPEQVREFLDFLVEQGVLHHSGPRYFWMSDQYPAQAVSLRSASADNVVLQAATGLDHAPLTIGQVDRPSAPWMVHPQAIYLHEGKTYLVDELDLEGGQAQLREVETDYYTQAINDTQVGLLEQLESEPASGGAKAYGEINVVTRVTGFKKIRWYTHEQLGLAPLDLPPTELQTTGYWLSLDEATVARLREAGLWTNDPNDYGPTWRLIRDLVRARDGYRCQVCGAAEEGRQHDVHHKIPFRSFASAEQANQMSNLATLCPACHRTVETNVRMRSGLAGLAFVLWHLAPFFLMCDTGDLGVHSDPQAPLADGQPAVILYDMVPAGIGLSQRLYEIHGELVQRAYELVSACECAEGCPSCVGPGGENGQGGKKETLAILEALL